MSRAGEDGAVGTCGNLNNTAQEMLGEKEKPGTMQPCREGSLELRDHQVSEPSEERQRLPCGWNRENKRVHDKSEIRVQAGGQASVSLQSLWLLL